MFIALERSENEHWPALVRIGNEDDIDSNQIKLNRTVEKKSKASSDCLILQ